MSTIQGTFGLSVPLAHALGISLGCYCLGCVSTGYYLVRLRLGRDIRERHSGNTGARNVGRVLGAGGFLVTLLGDIAKGICAVGLVWHFTWETRLAAVAMVAVVAGHIWPWQLRFRGGKGMATSLGALVAYDFHLTMIFAALFAGWLCLLRRTVLSGLVAFALIPPVAMFMGREAWEVVAVSVLAGMVLAAHRSNLVKEVTRLTTRHSVQAKPDESFK